MYTLLATDLDGTLVGNDSALISLNLFLSPLRDSGVLKLAYVTGRSLEMYTDLQREHNLLKPDALITAVGSEIYLDGVRQSDWPNVQTWDVQHVLRVLARYPTLRPQPLTEQRDYKRCYYFDDGAAVVPKIQAELGNQYTVIYSSNQYLDILPIGVNKATALQQLCTYWNLPATDIITAGDSGNDIAMLANYKGIIVGNASTELLEWQANSTNSNLYLAQASQAAGIYEGLQHFGYSLPMTTPVAGS